MKPELNWLRDQSNWCQQRAAIAGKMGFSDIAKQYKTLSLQIDAEVNHATEGQNEKIFNQAMG